VSVLKNKRGLSNLEFYHSARKLRREITNLLLRDFGVSDTVRKVKGESGEQVSVIESYPDWLLDEFRRSIIQILRNMMANITAGNTICPVSRAEMDLRRHYQTQAIINCEQLLQEMHYCEDVLPVAVSKFIPFVEAIEFEVALLKGWRKANNKIMKNAAEKREEIK
jgi:hypothetical protein